MQCIREFESSSDSEQWKMSQRFIRKTIQKAVQPDKIRYQATTSKQTLKTLFCVLQLQ
jgi:hypothetical protein